MLTKKSSKNQITLPKAAADQFGDVDYFEVIAEEERIILVPLRRSRAREVRAKLRQLGIDEAAVADAVSWARQQ
ncbi:MAG: AbrB/MazE/SpoVT family DNA-binding domain-containing protein [Acidobacteriota bacterium]|jgi:bifunctional DNA-binding transcriptional regulator/antitoxin component of YhaV-PrlF toxin-antitoxin module